MCLVAGAASGACQRVVYLDASGFMTVFDRLERRFGWVAFPGFLRYYALFHVLVFVLQFIRPDLAAILQFDRAKILSGEVWRVVTMFFADSEMGTPSPVAILFLIFVVNFIFMVSDGLEGAWGVFKTSLFYYTGIFLVLIANFLYPFNIPGAGVTLYGAAFLAFATLFPKAQILLFFFLPVQIRFLGIFAGLMIVFEVVADWRLLPFMLAGFANYIIWAAIPALRGKALVLESVQRKKAFNAATASKSDPFHACTVCARTDISDPQLEFRIGADGSEYCSEHLPE